MINQELYTSRSNKTFQRIKKDKQIFNLYHEGYRQQVDTWPSKPFDIVSEYLNQLNKQKQYQIADIGCGDANIARKFNQQQNINIQSFDLAQNEYNKDYITIADMCKLPVEDNVFDICIFSLSLMPTNLSDAINESWRITKQNGRLYILEVASRLNQQQFIKQIQQHGWKVNNQQIIKGNYLIQFEFIRQDIQLNKNENIVLQPCIYKRREVISLGIGQCGSQTLQQYFIELFNGITPNNDYERFLKIRNNDNIQLRTIFTDLEDTNLNTIINGPLQQFLNNSNIVKSKENLGAGNNFCIGYYENQSLITKIFEDKLQQQLEQCDQIDLIQQFHSLSGGTGSGLGSRIMYHIKDMYPKLQLISMNIIPSNQRSDVITSPYNSLLSMSKLQQYSDVILSFDNDKIYDSLNSIKIKYYQSQYIDQNSLTTIFNIKQNQQKTPFTDVNTIIGQSISLLSTSQEYDPSLQYQLCPLPQYKMIQTNYISSDNDKRCLQQLFQPQACLTVKQDLPYQNLVSISNAISYSNISNQNLLQLIKQNQYSKNICFKEYTSEYKLQKVLSSYHTNISSNYQIYSKILEQFNKLYQRKMYLHHYLKYMELYELEQDIQTVEQSFQNYIELQEGLSQQQLNQIISSLDQYIVQNLHQ